MAMEKLDKELETKLVRYETLMDGLIEAHTEALHWTRIFVESFGVKPLVHATTALIRKTYYHIQLKWLVNHDWDVAQYNHQLVEQTSC